MLSPSSESITLIDSPYANIANIERALKRAGAVVRLSADPSVIAASRSLLLPGVGAFNAAMKWLRATGVGEAIETAVRNDAALLGVCVGHQLLFDSSDELESCAGLGLIEGSVTRFRTSRPVPQVGWNRLSFDDSLLFEGIESGTPFYFVNSYRVAGASAEIARGDYGEPFTAAVRQGNIFGVQFHPEKSSAAGLGVLENFVKFAASRGDAGGKIVTSKRVATAVAASETSELEIIPSLDLLRGEVVRLTRGDFATAESYGTPEQVMERWDVPQGARLHVVDLEGSRQGRAVESEAVRRLVQSGYRVQVGGGIRSIEDAQRWLELGVERIVTGTVLADDPARFAEIVESVGASRITAAIDVRDDQVRVSGWERGSSRSIGELLTLLERLGVSEALVTDISVDGTMLGPALELYRRLAAQTSIRLIASGGVGVPSDLEALARIDGVSGVIVGRALHERRVTLPAGCSLPRREAMARRVIPCLDIRNGRVVKGVRFENLRDAGDPVEAALRYEVEGADELVVLDVSATLEERRASLETIRNISQNFFIPLTVGGGVRSVDDFRTLLQNGADRVAINTAAVADPQLIAACAAEFGVQAVVLAVDARRVAHATDSSVGRSAVPRFEVVVRSGSVATPLDVVEWCRRAEELGAGEVLLTSIDRDGTGSGFDLELLRAVASRLNIGVIASGGAGKLSHFADAVERGGAAAVLAASLFHDRVLSIGEVKRSMSEKNIDVRWTDAAEMLTHASTTPSMSSSAALETTSKERE